MEGMFLCKRDQQDIQPGIAFMSTRRTKPNKGDWRKLIKLMGFLEYTKNDVTFLSADDSNCLYWFVDAAFAVHEDFKSHTGAVFSLGKGSIISMSTKQKINTRSSTEAELVALDDAQAKILWTKLFIKAQDHTIRINIVYRDNQSSMKLEQNGKESSGKRTRHFSIKYFYATDLIKRGMMKIIYCPTELMVGDYMSKPLVRTQFNNFRAWIMNQPR